MRPWREIKKASQLAVHRQFEVPVLVRFPDDTVISVTARIHAKWLQTGDLGLGSTKGFAEIEDQQPELIFLIADFAAGTRGCLVCTEDNEAYELQSPKPNDLVSATYPAKRILKGSFPEYGLDDSLPFAGLVVS